MLSTSSYKYLLTCVDACTKYTWVYPIKLKSNVLLTFTHFVTATQVQFSTKVKAVQIDGGGEFQVRATLYSTRGVVHRFACPHTSPKWLNSAQA